jgi:hypothetical protein
LATAPARVEQYRGRRMRHPNPPLPLPRKRDSSDRG